MSDYYLTELHAHTKHSDGHFATAELLAKAQAFGYEILAITDHNTSAALHDCQKLTATTDLVILPGMEWTTFYGHLLVWGAREFIDWRPVTPATIDAALRQLKAVGGITGCAHPYAVGSPLCTGCRWDFPVHDQQLLDFVEVWNGAAPDQSRRSQQAYQLWLTRLAAGQRVAASAGRDWHDDEPATKNTALLYLGCQERTTSNALRNLAQGNFYLSLGPRLTLALTQNGQTYEMGATLATGPALVQLTFQATTQAKMRQFGFVAQRVRIFQNETVSCDIPWPPDTPLELPVLLKVGYLRVELWGTARGQTQQQLLVLANPFYVR
ncbi:CehA/McbA family metallohydrolase [Lapidilactobacillus luobeiensis]|uniref:CehA/McbA family metallohydrolase n=1 Tax=Lapidilactobacillus luobeiensis TaxID=2950371 RepID=UPI0021C3D5CA|nr:CehA/McbA family metallohydrolase [Lapidilactobacillus luobeiensis]